MIVLGIESTAHTIGVAILNEEEVLANERKLYVTESEGMIPSKVADHHIQHIEFLLKDALTKAKISLQDVDIVAFSQSPGLGHCLRIGTAFAKSLALLLNKPLVGVNHCIAHLEIGKMRTKAKDPVLLYASGANTQIIAHEAGKYRIFGETLDIGIGNLLDRVGRKMGLGFPGGPKIEQLALKGKTLIPLPYSVKGMDISLGGLQTKLEQLIRTGEYSKEDLCFSLQETVFAMLVEVSERAMAHCNKTELVLGGGVACNKRLQSMCEQMVKARNGTLGVPENQFLIDNAAMIAWTGLLLYREGKTLLPRDAKILPYLRTDEV